MMRFSALCGFVLPVLLAQSACAPSDSGGPVQVAVIGTQESLSDKEGSLDAADRHLQAASREGLVAFDAAGQVVPALAERWIVTDDGLSYIFRLRERSWPDDEPITAQDIEAGLNSLIAANEDTTLGLDLAKVIEVRVMTERVVELRLSSPMPDFLRLLAQSELGIAKDGSGAGPMVVSRDEDDPVATLSALPPQERGLPRRPNWEEASRGIAVRALEPAQAIAAFSKGEVDLLLNGRLAAFPQVELGPLSRGTIQLDPALGLMGLAFRSDTGLFATSERREALSMALDREGLIQPFGLGGWQPNSWIVPPAFFEAQGLGETRWNGLSIEERRSIAASRISAWRSSGGDAEPIVRLYLPTGPGSDLLYRGIAQAWAAIGIGSELVATKEEADLAWRDEVARYSSARWYLNQFNCALEGGLCSPEADELVRQSLVVSDPLVKQQLLADAHRKMVQDEVFIPLGAPVRWSLVRGAIAEYSPNQWGVHPLFALTGLTI